MLGGSYSKKETEGHKAQPPGRRWTVLMNQKPGLWTFAVTLAEPARAGSSDPGCILADEN